MKNRKIAMLTAITAVAGMMFAGVACEPTETPGGSGGEGTKPSSFLNVAEETVDMTLCETGELTVNYAEKAGATLVFTSSNDSVVRVDGKGNIEAVSEGTATITVTYAELSDTCEVTVGLNGNLPMIQLPYVPESNVKIADWSQLDLNGEVLFNGATYEDVTFTYVLSDASVGTVTNGVFTPAKVGATEIKVVGTWRGVAYETLTTTINVNVAEA